MHDRPTKAELLEMVERFLREDALTAAEGRVRYHLLVALNLLAVTRRELALEEAQLVAEARRLGRLLDRPSPVGVGGGRALAARVRRDNVRLCREIRAGAFADRRRRAGLYRHLRATLADKLAVANPRLLARVQDER